MKNLTPFSVLKQKTALALFMALLSATVFVSPPPALAHKVSIFAWVEGDMVHTQSNFFGGKKIQNASIDVLDASGKLLLQGKTDNNGEFSFKAPIKAAMKIVVSAGMGHQAVWNLKPSDFDTMEQDGSYLETVSSQAITPVHSSISLAEASSPPTAQASITSDEIYDIVEKALDKKLSPILKMLSELRNQGPTLRDVLGGIGYIIGLVGLVAYMGSRRKKR
jgi:nickel transport protein